jgi:hypothetical protein
MRSSDTINSISEALIEFQKICPDMPKDKTAKVPTKNGGTYEYDYLSLSTLLKIVKPLLSNQGLSIVQTLGQDEGPEAWVKLTTRLFHSSAEWIEDAVLLSRTKEFKDFDENAWITIAKTDQEMGATITYNRRYSLCALLGIEGDADLDADLSIIGAKSAHIPTVTTVTTTSGFSHTIPNMAEGLKPGGPAAQAASRSGNPAGEFPINFRKYEGKKVKDVNGEELGQYINWLKEDSAKKGKPVSPKVAELESKWHAYHGITPKPFKTEEEPWPEEPTF